MKSHIRISEEERHSMFVKNAEDTTRIAVAALLYATHLKHADKSLEERKEMITKMYNDIKSVYAMPEIMGKRIMSDDVINTIREEYGIDVTDLTVITEDLYAYMKR